MDQPATRPRRFETTSGNSASHHACTRTSDEASRALVNAVSFSGWANFLGLATPFDTGGILHMIRPVNEQEASVKQAYIKAFTFDIGESTAMRRLLAAYPGPEEETVAAYLRGDRPTQLGPHEVWRDAWSGELFPIWKDNPKPRTWTWEGRRPESLPDPRVVAWTCPTSTYRVVQQIAENASGQDLEWYEDLFQKYVQGGVGVMLRRLALLEYAA